MKNKTSNKKISNSQSQLGNSQVANSVGSPSHSFSDRQFLVRDFLPTPQVTEHGDQSVQQPHSPAHAWVLQALALLEGPSHPSPFSHNRVRNCCPPPHDALHWLQLLHTPQPSEDSPADLKIMMKKKTVRETEKFSKSFNYLWQDPFG